MNDYRVTYTHCGEDEIEFSVRRMAMESADAAVISVLEDRTIACPCCDPITVVRVEVKRYMNAYREVLAPNAGWGSLIPSLSARVNCG